MTRPTGFDGFPGETLRFLADLRDNNSREWFTANKPTYDRQLKRPAERFCAEMAQRLESLTGLPHEAKIFRIHRDLRFARDKTPYNAHLHISWTPTDVDGSPPAWMFGLSPDYLALGCGVFAFDPATLDAFRAKLGGAEGPAISGLVASLAEKGVRYDEPELKRVPSGYPAGGAAANLLRRKGLVGWIDLAPQQASDESLVATCMGSFGCLKALFDLLSELSRR